MIIAIVVGWVVVLPLLVIVGLLAAPIVTRRRDSALGASDALARSREFVGIAGDLTAAVDAQEAARRRPVGAGY